MEDPTVFVLYGSGLSSCGYCSEQQGRRSSKNESLSYGIDLAADTLVSCHLYMDMIDRGWRRSGTYLYKPDMKRTCCPQYSIKLDALQFSPTRSQRQISNRWNRFILEQDKEENGMNVDQPKSKASGKSVPPFELIHAVHAGEWSFVSDGHPRPAKKFEVTLEPSTYAEEKFQLYQRYQTDIHKEGQKTPKGFQRFLVETPLRDEPIPYPKPPPPHLPKNYGSYHQCYRLDDELIAVAVLDILPQCVSSVYFMYDKRWEKFSLGRLSALRETALAKEIHEAGIETMHALYMGFYVHTCPKMQYKGDYSPSFLLDPEDYTWYPFKECTILLAKHRYICFARPEMYFDEPPDPEEVKPIPETELEDVELIDHELYLRLPITESNAWKIPEKRDLILEGIHNLGLDVARQVIFLVV